MKPTPEKEPSRNLGVLENIYSILVVSLSAISVTHNESPWLPDLESLDVDDPLADLLSGQ